MKIFFTIVIMTLLSACGNSSKRVASQSRIQHSLFDTIFNYADIQSIDIVEIEHPMLGGIISTQTLTDDQKNQFIKKLVLLERAGLYKCGSKYVIRLILANDTLRLKTCGEKISSRYNDMYYCLPDSGKIIGDFIQK
jgi:hypothetical protein